MEYVIKGNKKKKIKTRRLSSIKEIPLSDGTVIGVFPGSRGANPNLDILIAYQEVGKSVRTPRHIHWVIDILIKKEHNPKLTMKFLRFLRKMYNKVHAFKSKKDRNNCILSETTKKKLKPFAKLNKYGEYKVDFIAHLIELMIKMEKNTPKDKPARVFKELIDSMLAEKEIFVIASKAVQKR